VLQRPFLGPENCTGSGQIYAIAAGEKRPPTPVSPPQAGPGIAECRSLIGQDAGKASSAGDVPCRHAHMAWNGGQRSPYEPMTLPCRRIGWVPLCDRRQPNAWPLWLRLEEWGRASVGGSALAGGRLRSSTFMGLPPARGHVPPPPPRGTFCCSVAFCAAGCVRRGRVVSFR